MLQVVSSSRLELYLAETSVVVTVPAVHSTLAVDSTSTADVNLDTKIVRTTQARETERAGILAD